MDPVPNPLRVGEPGQQQHRDSLAHRDSFAYIDPIGHRDSAVSPVSPVDESPISPLRSPVAKSSGSSKDRIAELFPSRNTSQSTSRTSLPRHNPQKRQSHPTPLLPASLQPASEPAYRIPQAPAPPTLVEEPTSYDRTPDPFNVQHPAALSPKPRAQGLASRFKSLRSPGRRGKEYDELAGDDIEVTGMRRRKTGTDELDDVDVGPIGMDIGGLMGPIALQQMDKKKNIANDMDRHNEIAQAGYAAEYERLEALEPRGTVGSGMDDVVDAQVSSKSNNLGSLASQQGTHRRGPSAANIIRDKAQQAAEKTGEILAVPEIPGVDLGNLEGGGYESRSVLTSLAQNAEGDTNKSYYFPEDPEQPSWRPFSMHWAWILFLVLIAIGLGALQEFVCQLSMKRAREDNTGVIGYMKPNDLSMSEYFSWKYGPTVVLVTYGVLWQTSDFEVKRLEPYYQLSKKTGALAAESLNIDYLTFLAWLTPFRALKHKQWAVVLSSLSTLLAGGLVPVLQSASVNVFPEKEQRRETEMKWIRIDPVWSRAVTGFLFFIALCGVVLLFQLRRKSGLLSDVQGIAGIAAMATRSHILNDFSGLDCAPQHIIHKQLRHRRYILHKASLWQGEYIRNSTSEMKEHNKDSRPIMLQRWVAAPFISFIIAFMVIIPVLLFIPAVNKVLDKAPWLLVAIAAVLKVLWATLDLDIRTIEPFYILSRRHAPPRTLTLDYTGTVPGWLVIKSFINKTYLVTLVAFGSVLTEIVTVCCSSFSVDGQRFLSGHGRKEDDDGKDKGKPDSEEAGNRYNTDETFKSFWVSFALVAGILIYMLTVAVVVYLRRSHRFMPRGVGTIASVLGYIHQSKMLKSFIDTERLEGRAMTKFIERGDKTYGLGWFVGRDGEDHCGIDEEEISAEYKWGVDWTKGRMTGANIGAWEHY